MTIIDPKLGLKNIHLTTRNLSPYSDVPNDPTMDTSQTYQEVVNLLKGQLVTVSRWEWYLTNEKNHGFAPRLLAQFFAQALGFIRPKYYRPRADKIKKHPRSISPWTWGYCLPLEVTASREDLKKFWPEVKDKLDNPIFNIEEFHIPAPLYLPDEVVSTTGTGRFLYELDYNFFQRFVKEECLEDIFETTTRQAEYQTATVDLLVPELVNVCFDLHPNFYEVIIQLLEFGYTLADIAASMMVLPDEAKREVKRNWKTGG
jgi:hypothetical protein